MELTGHNIANINTPHYKAQKLEFENLLLDKISAARSQNLYSHQMRYSGEQRSEMLKRELNAVKPQVRTDNITETRIDGNNVDVDFEFLQLSKQRLHYDFLVQRVAGAYGMLRHAVTEGRG
jgi:flagellar basal-body rod protein FlgB